MLEVKSAGQEWIENSIKLFLDWIFPHFEMSETDSKLTHEFRESELRRIFNRVIKEGLLWYQAGRNIDSLVRITIYFDLLNLTCIQWGLSVSELVRLKFVQLVYH
jgi:hypothetical protein